jgi:hypothetical protein
MPVALTPSMISTESRAAHSAQHQETCMVNNTRRESIEAAGDQMVGTRRRSPRAGTVRVLGLLGVAASALVVWACSSVQPVAIRGGDQCFRCRRPIVERAMAAELMDGNRFASKFRAPGCMAKYLVAHPGETGTTFVTDYVTGKWIQPARALFVPVMLNRDTGESDYRAFLNRADADATALEFHTAPIDWTDVLAEAARAS